MDVIGIAWNFEALHKDPIGIQWASLESHWISMNSIYSPMIFAHCVQEFH